MEKDFFKYQAQTTPHPLALEVLKAKGSYIYDQNQKGKPIDMFGSDEIELQERAENRAEEEKRRKEREKERLSAH